MTHPALELFARPDLSGSVVVGQWWLCSPKDVAPLLAVSSSQCLVFKPHFVESLVWLFGGGFVLSGDTLVVGIEAIQGRWYANLGSRHEIFVHRFRLCKDRQTAMELASIERSNNEVLEDCARLRKQSGGLRTIVSTAVADDIAEIADRMTERMGNLSKHTVLGRICKTGVHDFFDFAGLGAVWLPISVDSEGLLEMDIGIRRYKMASVSRCTRSGGNSRHEHGGGDHYGPLTKIVWQSGTIQSGITRMLWRRAQVIIGFTLQDEILRTLVKLGSVPTLGDMMVNNKYEHVRVTAAKALVKLGKQAEPAVLAIANAAVRGRGVVSLATELLPCLGHAAAKAMPTLVQAIEGDASTRFNAAHALRCMVLTPTVSSATLLALVLALADRPDYEKDARDLFKSLALGVAGAEASSTAVSIIESPCCPPSLLSLKGIQVGSYPCEVSPRQLVLDSGALSAFEFGAGENGTIESRRRFLRVLLQLISLRCFSRYELSHRIPAGQRAEQQINKH